MLIDMKMKVSHTKRDRAQVGETSCTPKSLKASHLNIRHESQHTRIQKN